MIATKAHPVYDPDGAARDLVHGLRERGSTDVGADAVTYVRAALARIEGAEGQAREVRDARAREAEARRQRESNRERLSHEENGALVLELTAEYLVRAKVSRTREKHLPMTVPVYATEAMQWCHVDLDAGDCVNTLGAAASVRDGVAPVVWSALRNAACALTNEEADRLVAAGRVSFDAPTRKRRLVAA